MTEIDQHMSMMSAHEREAAANRAMVGLLWKTKPWLRWTLFGLFSATAVGYFIIGQMVFGIILFPLMVYVAVYSFLITSSAGDVVGEMKQNFAINRQYIFKKDAQIIGLAPELFLRNFTSGDVFDDAITGELGAGAFELFSYAYEKNNSERTQYINVFRLHTTKTFPNMLVNGSYASYPIAKGTKRSELTLEGNFNKYFLVYVTSGEETLALQILTPDLMLWLIETQQRWIFECCGSDICVYFLAPIKTEIVLSNFYEHAVEISTRIAGQMR